MTEPVKCECGALFGIEQSDGALAIKYRDLFRVVRGSVSGPCRKCGATVVWPTPPVYIPPVLYPPTTYTCNCACMRCLSGDCCMTTAFHSQWTYTSNTTEPLGLGGKHGDAD